MRIVKRHEWDDTKEALIARVEAFKQAKAEHVHTEGVPAPLEEPVIVELAERETLDLALAADLPAELTAEEVDTRELDQLQSDRWVLNRLAKDFAARKGAPDYLVRHAGRVPDEG